MSGLCLRHGAYLNGTSNMFTYLLIIFLGQDWLVLFKKKLDTLRNGILAQRSLLSSE